MRAADFPSQHHTAPTSLKTTNLISPSRPTTATNLAATPRRRSAGQGGLLNRMFGGSLGLSKEKPETLPQSAIDEQSDSDIPDREHRSPPPDKRRSSFNNFLSNARNSLQFAQSPLYRLSKMDPALAGRQGAFNNSAGDSMPSRHSSFRVGVTEDKNRKCRRTMEDTHTYLYNFLGTPVIPPGDAADQLASNESVAMASDSEEVAETDNGYFAIFDGHAGSFAAEWCGKKLHLILAELFKKNPHAPVPELLDQTFTSVDYHLERLPMKNSGCTAVIAVLRWEDRIQPPSARRSEREENPTLTPSISQPASPRVSSFTEGPLPTRHRILYTANVGDARAVLCRNGKALRLSYDHKGSDETEGKRITHAGGLVLSNRVNGVLAVTRALGDSYMKSLVTGHPYTTETFIVPDVDEFLILACDGVCCP